MEGKRRRPASTWRTRRCLPKKRRRRGRVGDGGVEAEAVEEAGAVEAGVVKEEDVEAGAAEAEDVEVEDVEAEAEEAGVVEAEAVEEEEVEEAGVAEAEAKKEAEYGEEIEANFGKIYNFCCCFHEIKIFMSIL
jgi:hypothetical protein